MVGHLARDCKEQESCRNCGDKTHSRQQCTFRQRYVHVSIDTFAPQLDNSSETTFNDIVSVVTPFGKFILGEGSNSYEVISKSPVRHVMTMAPS